MLGRRRRRGPPGGGPAVVTGDPPSRQPEESSVSITFTLNGQPTEVEPRSDETLLETLRERCGVRSVKDGCAPQGQCGCCLALVGGRAVTTCAMPVAKAAGKDIVTLEGVTEAERAADGRRLRGRGRPAVRLLHPRHHRPARQAPDSIEDAGPSRDEIAKAIDVHLCRCTGYVKIIDAVQLLARARRGEPVPKPEPDGGVGKRARPASAARSWPWARGPTSPTCAATACCSARCTCRRTRGPRSCASTPPAPPRTRA
jgi:aerobic-type carbon monoxide dehydrogenase small subunit (CoxS/CutS family)